MNTLRAFIAIEMPPMVVDAVRQKQQALKCGNLHLRWVRPENIHLTLRFLGDIPPAAVVTVQAAMKQAVFQQRTFSLMVKGGGVFPGIRRPRVVWLGIEGEVEALGNLQRHLTACLADQGIPVENRAFKGHLTIARVKGRLDDEELGRMLSSLSNFKTDPFAVKGVHLFKSDLKPQGPVYTRLMTVDIGKPS